MDDKRRTKRSRSGGKKKRSRSASRSPSPTYARPKKSSKGFSNFSDKPPEL